MRTPATWLRWPTSVCTWAGSSTCCLWTCLFLGALVLSAQVQPTAAGARDGSIPEVSGPDGSIDLFCFTDGAPDYGCCESATIFDPEFGFGRIQIAIAVRLAGATANGISGAEFYIDGLDDLPGQWQCQATPVPLATMIGDICNPSEAGHGETVRRGNIFFNVSGPSPEDGCQSGTNHLVPLGDVTLSTFADEVDLDILYPQVVAGAPPGNPNFPCPLVTLCDAPAFTKVCVSGGIFVINNGLLPATNPSPADGDSVHHVGVQLEWESPRFVSCVLGVLGEDLYFGTSPEPPRVVYEIAAPPYDPGPLDPLTTYYWTVGRRFGTTSVTSPVWSFTTTETIAASRTTWTAVKQLFR